MMTLQPANPFAKQMMVPSSIVRVGIVEDTEQFAESILSILTQWTNLELETYSLFSNTTSHRRILPHYLSEFPAAFFQKDLLIIDHCLGRLAYNGKLLASAMRDKNPRCKILSISADRQIYGDLYFGEKAALPGIQAAIRFISCVNRLIL